MDSAMRDLDQLKERGEQANSPRNRLGLAAIAFFGVATGLYVQLGSGEEDAVTTSEDPLARLEQIAQDGERTTGRNARETTPAVGGLEPRTRLDFQAALQEGHGTASLDDIVAAARAELLAGEELVEPSVGAAVQEPAQGAPNSLDPQPSSATTSTEAPTADPTRAAPLALRLETGGTRSLPQDTLLAPAAAIAPTTAAASPGAMGTYTIQIISYDRNENADAFARQLREHGHRAFVMRAEIPDRGIVYRVRVGPFATLGEAQRTKRSLEEREGLAPIVLRTANQP